MWLRREEEAEKTIAEDRKRVEAKAMRIMTSKGMSKAAWDE